MSNCLGEILIELQWQLVALVFPKHGGLDVPHDLQKKFIF